MDLKLSGKCAVITGGSGGIGRGLVLEFAREGVNVVSASRDVETGERIAEEAREQSLPGEILPVAPRLNRLARLCAIDDGRSAIVRLGVTSVGVREDADGHTLCRFK